MNSAPVYVIDERAKDDILRFPTVEMIRILFPDVKMHGRSVLCNPLRGERHASLSCFRSRNGLSRWRDWATGESGDNIDFFRKAFPDLGYVEAVDKLSNIILGRSALSEKGLSRPVITVRPHKPEEEKPSALKIISVSPLVAGAIPSELVSYWRGRGISDEVVSGYCSGVLFENVNLAGRIVIDAASGLPVYGPDGEPLRQDGRSLSVAMRNDVGGWSFRVPEMAGHPGFKGCDHAFVTTIYADGSFVNPYSVGDFGNGSFAVERIFYNENSGMLYFNPGRGFTGVSPAAFRYVRPFLEDFQGKWLEGRDYRGVRAMLSALKRPIAPCVAVVEGLFDALSLVELNRMSGKGSVPGTDVVVLNSVSNMGWAVPFLAAHQEVRSYLDNDLRSSAGQKAFVNMESLTAAYGVRCASSVSVVNASGFFYPYKDVNDYLKAIRGFDGVSPVPVRPERTPSRKSEVKR